MIAPIPVSFIFNEEFDIVYLFIAALYMLQLELCKVNCSTEVNYTSF
jgi:hypothetical protein